MDESCLFPCHSGPFFVKSENGYVLSDICKDCAFGDEDYCCLNPCIHLYHCVEESQEGASDAKRYSENDKTSEKPD